MSHILACVGAAVFEVIGLNPQQFDYHSEASWAEAQIFQGDILYQPTGMGKRELTLRALCRPHVMGGLEAYAVMKQQHELQLVVPYIRLGAGVVGEVMGDVFVANLGHSEQKLAPNGIGYRHEFDFQLTFCGASR